VFLISDEAYQRIVFPGATFVTPTACYSHSFLLYSYGKTLLAPGQRLGYLALAPSMPDAEEIRSALFLTQVAGGHGWPDAVMQHALPTLESLCIDLASLCRRRDLLVGALTDQGYELESPQGTFYLLVRSPIADDSAFAEILADDDIFVLPGQVVDMPGYFRLSLTANDEMVARSVDRFAKARARTERRVRVGS
jgi:aspartate aminotransferase